MQDPVNKYIRLYSQKLMFEDSDTLKVMSQSTVIPILLMLFLDRELLKDFVIMSLTQERQEVYHLYKHLLVIINNR